VYRGGEPSDEISGAVIFDHPRVNRLESGAQFPGHSGAAYGAGALEKRAQGVGQLGQGCLGACELAKGGDVGAYALLKGTLGSLGRHRPSPTMHA
jgi:hypothetical protein